MVESSSKLYSCVELYVGVIAYVDVRSKGRCENRSKAVANQLDTLGATVSP